MPKVVLPLSGSATTILGHKSLHTVKGPHTASGRIKRSIGFISLGFFVRRRAVSPFSNGSFRPKADMNTIARSTKFQSGVGT